MGKSFASKTANVPRLVSVSLPENYPYYRGNFYTRERLLHNARLLAIKVVHT